MVSPMFICTPSATDGKGAEDLRLCAVRRAVQPRSQHPERRPTRHGFGSDAGPPCWNGSSPHHPRGSPCSPRPTNCTHIPTDPPTYQHRVTTCSTSSSRCSAWSCAAAATTPPAPSPTPKPPTCYSQQFRLSCCFRSECVGISTARW